jgi:hypothetical protein
MKYAELREEKRMTIRFIRSLLFGIVMVALSAASFAQIGVSISFGPPALPVYEQPICPGDGYLWTPGYWAYDNDIGDYYWVPGTWVLAPEVGFLWTPGYWGWGGGGFLFHEGYWGPHVGFYGGIAYGFGYFGVGFQGGRWDGGHFFYNRSVANVNVTNIHNVYNTTVINNTTVNRVSYNGGNGGITARATPEEEAAEHDRHLPPAAVQTQHMEAARADPQQRASVNHGKPAVAATPRPGAMHDGEAVGAKEAGAPYNPPANRGAAHPEENGAAPRPENNVPRPAVHPSELPAAERPAAPNTGNPKLDKKYQQQQEKLYTQQNQERQNLQQKQEQEHQQLAKQNANDAKKQQVEQRHQQQTQQLQQKHVQQQQHLQQKQQPAHPSEPRKP